MQPCGGVPPLLKICFCFYLRLGLGSWASPGPHGAPTGEVTAQNLEAVGPPRERWEQRGSECPRGGGQEASQPRRRQEGPKLEGWRGNWRPTNWLPAKPRELLGKSWARLKCQGHRSRRTAGVEMWVTAAGAPGMLGGALAGPPPHPHPQDAPPPRGLPGEGRGCWGGRGPGFPTPTPRESGPGLAIILPSPPDGWAGGQPAPPRLPNQTLENPEQPLLSSQRKPRARQLSRPASPPQAACKAGGGLTP